MGPVGERRVPAETALVIATRTEEIFPPSMREKPSRCPAFVNHSDTLRYSNFPGLGFGRIDDGPRAPVRQFRRLSNHSSLLKICSGDRSLTVAARSQDCLRFHAGK